MALLPVETDRYSGCSAVGSASGLGPGGRRFESCHPDKNLSQENSCERFFCFRALKKLKLKAISGSPANSGGAKQKV